MYTEYLSNNSGGSWWLKDKDWRALEKAGWVVAWVRLAHVYNDDGGYVRDGRGVPVMREPIAEEASKSIMHVDDDGRWLGALAKTAYRPGLGMREAAAEWERVTGESSTEAGCPCCGQPHTFTEYDDSGKYVASGPSVSYEAEW